MKLAEALKKFGFLKRLSIPDKLLSTVANHLVRMLKGDAEELLTPLAKRCDPLSTLLEWEHIFKSNASCMNTELIHLEISNLSKYGPRSVAVPWSQRIDGIKSSYSNQVHDHIPKFHMKPGLGNLHPVSLDEAINKSKMSSASGLPLLCKKRKAEQYTRENFAELLARKDPCMLYTRTTEKKKTRNVWGYPFADTLFEMRIYLPLLHLQKNKPYRTSLVGPDAVAQSITDLIDNAISNDLVLYSVDFAAFDASIRHQYIKLAFDYVKSCYDVSFHIFIDYICERLCTIGIVTPTGIYNGIHGMPSGSTFTNEIDSIVQLGIALTCKFIKEHECQVQGDDGVYTMHREETTEFEEAFAYAGLKLEKSKSHISSNSVIFCQNLYHIDYKKDGLIGGIYPTFRALNRIMYPERFVDFTKIGIQSKDYFGIRTLTILENCKYHPLFEELVRFVLSKEKYSLDISDDGLQKYCKHLNLSSDTASSLNHQYGSQVSGIRNFEAYKLVQKILTEEEVVA